MLYGNIICRVQLLIVETGEILEYTSETHDIAGNITRSNIAGLNSGDITINNIPPSTFAKIWKPKIGSNTRQIILRVEIGREGLGLFLVCEKDIIENSFTKNGQTYQAQFTAISSQNALIKNISINQKQATLQTILQDFSQKTGVSIGEIQTKSDNIVTFITPPQTGFSTLKELERAFPNVNIYTDNNKLYAYDKNTSLGDVQGYVLTGQQFRTPPVLRDNRINCDCHFDPRIGVFDIIEIDSGVAGFLNGKYKSVQLSHNFNITRTQNISGSTNILLQYFP